MAEVVEDVPVVEFVVEFELEESRSIPVPTSLISSTD